MNQGHWLNALAIALAVVGVVWGVAWAATSEAERDTKIATACVKAGGSWVEVANRMVCKAK